MTDVHFKTLGNHIRCQLKVYKGMFLNMGTLYNLFLSSSNYRLHRDALNIILFLILNTILDGLHV